VFDPVQAQDDLMYLLLSDSRLQDVAVKSYRRMRLANETDYRKILEGRSPRGRAGSGILVCQPTANADNTNVTGPVLTWVFPIIALEHPGISFQPETGTLLSAEQLAQIVLDIIQLYADEHLGTFNIQTPAIAPEKEFVFKGCLGYRVNARVLGRSLQTGRCGPVTVTVNAGFATLSCVTSNSQIYFTLDGSFPGNNLAGNSLSQLYSTPVAVVSGQVLRAIAYAPGMNPSACRYVTIA
jgi:Chitobiase/beta-hexosaminidase C-terminal domain